MLTQVLGKLGETSKLMKQKVLQEITEDLVRKIVLKLDARQLQSYFCRRHSCRSD